jgi:hypothetical protein
VWIAASLIIHAVILASMAMIVLHSVRSSSDLAVFESGLDEIATFLTLPSHSAMMFQVDLN